jgi:hypothetical protein
MTSIAGGPAPVVHAPPPPVGTAGDAARADARVAAVVAASSVKEPDPLPKRDAAYGLKSPVNAHEASRHYDPRGKVAGDKGREKPGRNIDIEV